MVLSRGAGFIISCFRMGALYALLAGFANRQGWSRRFGRTPFVNSFFGKAQIVSASAMGVAHGMNDAQKSMGIIALALAGATATHQFDHLPEVLHVLRIEGGPNGGFEIPIWVKVLSALTLAAGTAGGGWRIIKQQGKKQVKT